MIRQLLAAAASIGVALGAAVVAPSAPVPPASGLPSSIAALGDSVSRAWGSAGAPRDNPAASSSTGDRASLHSQYERLLALNPAIAGRNFNDASSSSTIATTLRQARKAIAQRAQYVTIESGTNDVCTPTTAGMTGPAAYARALRATLTRLTRRLPDVRVFVTSIPDFVAFWRHNSADPAAVSAWAATEPVYRECLDVFGAHATRADRVAVRARTVELNEVARAVCASFARCRHDRGAVFSLWQRLTPEDVTFDWFHLSEQGQAKLAAATWPETPFGRR